TLQRELGDGHLALDGVLRRLGQAARLRLGARPRLEVEEANAHLDPRCGTAAHEALGLHGAGVPLLTVERGRIKRAEGPAPLVFRRARPVGIEQEALVEDRARDLLQDRKSTRL